MATPYTKLDGVNYKIQAGLPSGGVDTLQFTDSASSYTQTLPAATGTVALTTLATGANALVTTDMAAAFRTLDGLVMPSVAGYLTNTPPGSPANGDVYIIGAAPTGAWAGQSGKVTRYSTVATAWEFYTPKNGWMLEANSARESYRYTGSAWEIFYQEGTWTPVIAGATTPGSHTYTAQEGSYRGVGAMCFVACRVIVNVKDAGMAGNAIITGLPFTSSSAQKTTLAVWAYSLNAVTNNLSGWVSNSATAVDVYKNAPSAGPTPLVAADIQNGSAITFAGCFPL